MITAASLPRKLVRHDNVFWMLAQQVSVRGLQASKFLLAARYLGPQQIGLVGIATLTLAIVESLSDTGMAQAVVQRPNRVSSEEAGAIWLMQLLRGLALGVLLLALAVPITLLLQVPTAAGLVMFAGVIPLVRNSSNPGVFLVQRERNFRRLSIYETASAVVDIGVSIFLIYRGVGELSILIGTVAGELLKVLLSWTWFRVPVIPSFRWSKIKEFTDFGKWIWRGSVINLILNQFDKVLVARAIGAAELGLYQMAARLAQLIVADAAIAVGQYLFPTFSQKYRISSSTVNRYFKGVISILLPLGVVVTMLLAFSADWIVGVLLGRSWLGAVPLLQIMSVSMFFGGLIAILVAYLRSIGAPQRVTQASMVQLCVLGLCAPVMVMKFGSIGMAAASAIALGSATLCLAIRVIREFSK